MKVPSTKVPIIIIILIICRASDKWLQNIFMYLS